jgi:hypothetical protein
MDYMSVCKISPFLDGADLSDPYRARPQCQAICGAETANAPNGQADLETLARIVRIDILERHGAAS